MTDNNTIWLVDFNGIDRKQYVLAPDERKVHTILKRMYRAPRYDFDWEDYELTNTGSDVIESAAGGTEPPFSVLEAKQYCILEHEKQVNQIGYPSMSVNAHKHRVQDIPNVLSIEPQKDGELRFEVYAGVEVGFKSRRKPLKANAADTTQQRARKKIQAGPRYQVAIYKNGQRWRELTDDYDEAVELFRYALQEPKKFREMQSS